MDLYSSAVKIRWVGAVAWIISLGAHVGVVTVLVRSPEITRTPSRHSMLSFSVVTPPHKPQMPQPKAAKPPLPLNRRPPRATSAAIKPQPVVPETVPPNPVDLTGVTLTGKDGAGWSSMTGNGLAMDAPIAPTVVAPHPPPIPEPGPKTVTVASSRTAPALVPLRELAEKPIPPPLNAKLIANYPAAAKRQGIAGKAKIRARIDADGLVRQASVLSESAEGFGAACRQTLLGSNWSKPRTLTGQAVVTEIFYTCDFRVGG